jgi:hypothetical protein
MKLINETQVKRYIKDQYPNARVSKLFLDRLEGKIRRVVDLALQVPANRKLVREL